MKSHTSEFKEEIKTLGKQQSVRITYTLNNEQIILTDEDINSATPNYEASLLKSVMKGLDLDSNTDIPLGTEIKFEYGLLVNGAYEYLNYGNYIVYSSEKQEDTLSYKIKCYDKMLYSMKDYEHIEITYPCTIKEYLIVLCNKIGLEFKDSTFANQNREIQNELFMTTNEDGAYSSMGYTYRDVLDQIAETTGGCICLTLDDKVEVRYVNKTINYEQSEKSNIIQFKTEVEEPIILERLEGKSIQATRSGKNLLDIKNENMQTRYCTKEYNGNSLTLTSDKTAIPARTTIPVDYPLNKALTISFDATFLEGYDLNSSSVIYFRSGSTNIGRIELTKDNQKHSYSITIPNGIAEEGYTFWLYIKQSPIEGVVSIKFDNIQIEQGTTATEYEQYGASPSPEFPSEIQSVGDKGTVTIEQRGKNLYNKNGNLNYPSIFNQNKTTLLDNGTIKTTANYSQWASTGYQLKNIIQNTDYTLSGRLVSSTGAGSSVIASVIVYGYSNNKWNGIGIRHLTKVGVFNIKFNSGTYSDFFISLNANGTIGTSYEAIFENIQVEKNSEPTDYEPYFSKDYVIPLSAPLRSLPNGTKDTIEEDGIHRRVGSVVLDGSEDERWQLWNFESEEYIGFRIDDYIDYNNSNGSDVRGMCNLFSVIVNGNSKYENLGLRQVGDNFKRIYICIKKTNLETKDINGFKTWLQQNLLQLIYELSEEVVEPFTDEQLEVLNSIETQKGTNIFELESNAILNYPVNYDTIDEEYINNTNVSFGEKYGAINSIVLARAGESDKIYKKDQASIDENGLCELMISENQFMNFNDRSDYLQELSDKLFGVEYYLNDFTSTGIMYYDLLDVYNVKIGDKTYNCLMLNDEQDITQGLEENIHTERPEKSETDYTKADKTDQKINQTNLVVDKQNQKIEGVISQIGDRSEKTTTITADIDGLNSKVSNIADLTKTTSGVGILTLDNCANGELLRLNILGNNTVFAPLVLSDNLYLDVESILIVTDEKGNATNYDLKITDTLRQKNNIRDEYVLENGNAKIIRRINIDGSIKDNEEIEDLGELHIILEQGENTIQIKDFSAEMQIKWVQKSDLTDTFATKVQLNTSITQTSTQIMTEVNKKVDEEEFGTKIEQNSEAVKLAWNQISEYIQMMIINGNASLAILDNSKKILMSLDKTGQHFYDSSENKIGDIGVINYKNTPMIAFNLNVSQNNNKRNGLGNRKKWNILSDFLYCRNIL